MLINGQHFRTIWVSPEANTDTKVIDVIDQTKLPHEFVVHSVRTLEEMITAIKTMQVRGAPLIGAAAAYGVCLALQKEQGDAYMQAISAQLIHSRPTAVNLRWAVERMNECLLALEPSMRSEAAWQEAAAICDEDVQLNQSIGQHGLALIKALQTRQPEPKVINILTHCNAGWLATVDFGTALSPIYAAHDAGIAVHVWVDETRPRNQGASLTAWELAQHGVPHTVISDNAGGHLMQKGMVDMVIVGADRVTAAGDVCNKIGTYLKALAAYDNGVPFYAAVPSPTIDWKITDGLHEIEIEERDAHEVSRMTGRLDNGAVATIDILPPNTLVANPAFDVTPARLVTGIITELGVYQPGQLAHMKQALINKPV
jgi:methylthioribose-1-phosphate isomerase